MPQIDHIFQGPKCKKDVAWCADH